MPANKKKLFFKADKGTQLVYINLTFKLGSVFDSAGKSGLASLTLSMLLRGTKKKDAKKFHETLDELGAEIYLGKNMESSRISAIVLKENFEKFLGLFIEMIQQPRFSEEEFKKLKKQSMSIFK